MHRFNYIAYQTFSNTVIGKYVAYAVDNTSKTTIRQFVEHTNCNKAHL